MAKKNFDESKLTQNPFMVNPPIAGGIPIRARSFNKTDKLILESVEGIYLPAGKLNETVLVEDEVFTKVYHDVKYRDIILNLSHDALRLWTYITYDITSNKDFYWMNMTFITRHLRLRSSFELKQIIDNELVRYAFITPTQFPNVYWINPAILFCGNRMKKYPQNVVVR